MRPLNRRRRTAFAGVLKSIYTPRHGSWLNMAELEIGVLGWQCLNRRIADIETMEREVQTWVSRCNDERGTVRWRFTTSDARIKLQHLYPRI